MDTAQNPSTLLKNTAKFHDIIIVTNSIYQDLFYCHGRCRNRLDVCRNKMNEIMILFEIREGAPKQRV